MRFTQLLPVIIALSFSSTFLPVQAQSASPAPVAQVTLKHVETAPVEHNPALAVDTTSLQSSLLMKINEGLIRGTLTPAEATNFKEELNQLGDAESWYKSSNMPVPGAVVRKNVQSLNSLNAKVAAKLMVRPKAANGDSLHQDIDELIGAALAKNKISSRQAEEYYSRLAQIESNWETDRADQDVTKSGAGDLKQSLGMLRADLNTRLQPVRGATTK